MADYKKTLNLPDTPFPMRGDLAKRESSWVAAKLDSAGKADLSAVLPQLSGVVAAYLIGEAASQFAEQLQGHLAVTPSGTLAQAVADVLAAAQPGDVVLFSPAAASFDQYRDFEDRGQAFRAAVAGL